MLIKTGKAAWRHVSMLLKRYRLFICIYPAPISVMFKRKVLKTELHIIMKLKNRNDTILFDMGHGFDIFGSEMNL